MTQSFTAQISQGRNGTPLSVRAIWSYSLLSDADSPHRIGVGVKTTPGAPAAFADLSHIDGFDTEVDESTFWDAMFERYRETWAAGVETGEWDSRDLLKRSIPLDTNYVAGRYLWVIRWANNSVPSGADVPTQLAGPYLIR